MAYITARPISPKMLASATLRYPLCARRRVARPSIRSQQRGENHQEMVKLSAEWFADDFGVEKSLFEDSQLIRRNSDWREPLRAAEASKTRCARELYPIPRIWAVIGMPLAVTRLRIWGKAKLCICNLRRCPIDVTSSSLVPRFVALCGVLHQLPRVIASYIPHLASSILLIVTGQGER